MSAARPRTDSQHPHAPVPGVVAQARLTQRLTNGLADIVLGPEGPQRFSTKVSLSGLVTYLPCMLLVFYCDRVGLMRPDLVAPITAAMLLTMVVFYAALRSGWSRRFADPGLILPQMLASLTWDAIGYATMREAHAGMLMPAALTVTYGVFALRGPAVYAVQGYTLLTIGATMICMGFIDPVMFPPREEAVVYASFVVAVVMIGWSGHQLAQLRQRERETRAELTVTLEQIQERATHDALTGLHNRRYMQSALAHHLARAERDQVPLALAMLDIDHFKQVNDRHGHGVGDAVLAAFARIAEGMLPTTEVIGRWGGEEFLVLSTRSISCDDLKVLIDRVREELFSEPIAIPEGTLTINFSAGLACHLPGSPVSAVLDAADHALYAAKQRGRGRSEIALGPAVDIPGPAVASLLHASA